MEWNEQIIEYSGNDYGILAECQADLGHFDRAIAAIREAVATGWREMYGGMLNQPPVMLDALAGNPEYEALVEEINADLSLQLERVHAMLNIK